MRIFHCRLFRTCAALAAALVLLSGCSRSGPERKKYTYYDAFDTVISLTVYDDDFSPEVFEERLAYLDGVFDAYEPHEGIAGVYALNHAGGEWLEVAPELYALLEACQENYARFDRRVNILMGNLTGLWRRYREAGVAIPDARELAAAAAHTDPTGLELDGEGRARMTDPQSTLDVGAVAKGYAVELLAQMLEQDLSSFLIDAGGNVRAGGKPLDGRESWTVGVQDPSDASRYVCKLALSNMSAVTSGGYQRCYEVDGVRYHHLIDPDTYMPANYVLQVTILTEDSLLADYLSTEAFLLPYERSRARIDALEGVEAIWVQYDGTVEMTDGARAMTVK